ncbi:MULTISPECIES: bifunctional adenosylcobinamide kinase/adenosylcobinamide-phosphate guanylyltransferase [Vibrio]|uniref:Bifunctional adenosylcobalamin biosynthesis protein n=1 Tax=Vibrio bivalvicida TaxID=1276888 RepID=A0A177XVU1_9VIBR|nr:MULTISPECIES: bifunctional adenosylcobinamide kinase/adenosylcobinamide-phosphate guanylyltransferase [Vibrio]KLN65777.1 adenosylcobinamide kinase [Vibrio sp. VPAP30]OAJ92385.1 bifunctional adenosylcobinamide kinase/adenosylcobinamide-phosphate guanylyltransferase [Vibrio bivalvicida]
MTIHLILGGARSGKSSFAEAQTENICLGNSKHYVATAIAFDNEMKQRVAHHQASRGDSWIEHECPIDLVGLISQFTATDVVLIDCLTLWLNNVIYNDGATLNDHAIKQQVEKLVLALEHSKADILMVSNEVGLGVIPLGEVSRLFVDHAGWMNQAIARVADKVTFVAAGLPMTLKETKEK